MEQKISKNEYKGLIIRNYILIILNFSSLFHYFSLLQYHRTLLSCLLNRDRFAEIPGCFIRP